MSEIVRRDQEDSLAVYRILLETFKHCERQGGPYLNLCAIFFHDLMIILSGSALRRNEIESGHASEETLGQLSCFPYVGYQDLQYGIDPNAKLTKTPFSLRASSRRFFHALDDAWRGQRGAWRGSVAILPSVLQPDRIWRELVNRRVRPVRCRATRLKIPALEEQLIEIGRCIDAVVAEIDLPLNPEDLSHVIRGHIMGRLAQTPIPALGRIDAVLTGSLCELPNRMSAAAAQALGVPVVAIMHGEQAGVLDEPVVGYGEFTYATTSIGYGSAGRPGDGFGFVRSLYDLPTYIESTSPVLWQIYGGNRVLQFDGLHSREALYVPTSFSGYMRYGPFRDLPDRLYRRWQETLLKHFPRLVLKPHPNKSLHPGFGPRNASTVIEYDLVDVLDHYSVVVTDYVSTALAVAAATNKPLLHLNLGLRNMTNLARECLKRRAIWVDVDPQRSGAEIYEQVTEAVGSSRENEFTRIFSLASKGDRLTREAVASELLVEMLS